MKVSILIPCFNAGRWVRSAIESALSQSWPNKEVIVVDDGSTDNSLDVIRSFGDAIRWETGPNRGGNVARNRLLELAKGEWLQYLDADDCLLKDHVARQMEVVQSNSNADVVYSPVIMEHWPAETDPEAGAKVGDRQVLPIPAPHDPWILLIRWYLPQTGAAMWRREAVREVGSWKPDQPCCQEHELYLRLLVANKVFVLNPEPGAVYRQWSTGTVCRKNPLQTFRRRLDIVRAAEQHLQGMDGLTPARRSEIAATRVECARSIYQWDPKEASQIVRLATATQRMHLLPNEPAFPWSFRAAYQCIGFRGAERLASATRYFRRATRGMLRLSRAERQSRIDPRPAGQAVSAGGGQQSDAPGGMPSPNISANVHE